MHPNVFLKTFWRMDLRPQVFVAMSFDPQYQHRFDNVIAPAIKAIPIRNAHLEAYRVDTSKSGDSILTDIMEGIAHSQMVLADVSTVGYDSKTCKRYRNGNVMYEVGLALACRQSCDVLLIRDDNDKFLFDVSTVPHKWIDFTDIAAARQELQNELIHRLQEQTYLNDARIRMAVESLSTEEIMELKMMAKYSPTTIWGPKKFGTLNLLTMVSIPRLLEKGLIRLLGKFETGSPAYQTTPLGQVVVKIVESGLQKFQSDQEPEKVQEQKVQSANEEKQNPKGEGT
jgi:hypothetical protein